MVAKIYGFMDMTMRPVNPSPRFDLIKVRFPLCLLCWSVTLSRLGSPTILVRTGCGKTSNSWSELAASVDCTLYVFIGLGRLVQGEIS